MDLHAHAQLITLFERAMLDADQLVAAFTARLLALDEELGRRFAADQADWSRRFLEAAHKGIAGLSHPETIMPAMHRLGRALSDAGLDRHHYELLRRALVQSVSDASGDALPEDVADALLNAAFLLTGLMQEGAP